MPSFWYNEHGCLQGLKAFEDILPVPLAGAHLTLQLTWDLDGGHWHKISYSRGIGTKLVFGHFLTRGRRVRLFSPSGYIEPGHRRRILRQSVSTKQPRLRCHSKLQPCVPTPVRGADGT